MRIFKNIFAVLGVLASLLVLAGMILFFYGMNFSGEKIDLASKKDTLFILNWGGLDNTQQYEVLHSYQSAPHFLGDHLDYYCLQLETFTPNSRNQESWVFGAEENSLINEARTFVFSSAEAERCFNEKLSGLEDSIAAYIWAIRVHSRHVSGAQIIFYHRPSNKVLYVSLET